MRCAVCSGPVGYDEAVFGPHPEYQDLQPYCMDCVPLDFLDDYPDDDLNKEIDDHGPTE